MFEPQVLAHWLLRIVHLGVGGAGLVLFWIPVFTRPGSRAHVRFGRWFAWCAMVVGISGVVSSSWALLHLPSFAASYANPLGTLDEETARLLRFLFAILGFLSIAVLEGGEIGLAAARFRRHNERLRTTRYGFAMGALALASMALACFGLVRFVEQLGLAAEARSRYFALDPIAVVAGGIGGLAVLRHVRYALGPAPTAVEWQIEHARNMLGLGSGFYTAFAVFGFNRLAPGWLAGWQLLLPWVVVPLAGTVGSEIWLARMRRRLMRERNPAPVDARTSGG